VEYRATVRALHLTAERALAAHADAKQLAEELRMLVAVMHRRCWRSLGSVRSPPPRC
jgi:hypothetical protein